MSHRPDDAAVPEGDRLSRIDRRLVRIERLMGLASIDEVDLPAVQTVSLEREPVAAAEAPAPPGVARAAGDRRREAAREMLARRAAAAPATPRLNLERLIGGRFFAGLGALIVTLGVGYFLHLAYTWGWFRMSADLKCGLAAVFGAALLVGGELARRRIGSAAAAGLSAAGVATLLVVSYAAHAVYGLYGATTAFAAMAVATAVGGAIAWGGASALVGIVAVLGAYVAPVLLGSRQSHAGVVQAYLTVVLALGLWMSWALTARSVWFGAVRTVAWLGTMFLGYVYCEGRGGDSAWISLSFLAVCTLLIHAELGLSARRDDEAGAARMKGGAARWFASGGRMVLTSVGSVAWCVALAVSLCRRHWPELDWAPAAVGMAGCLAGAVKMMPARELLRRPRTLVHTLASALAAQAGGLLIAAVALSLEGPARIAAWLALGVGAAVAGRTTRAVAVEVYAVLLLLLGSARIVIDLLHASVASDPWWSIGVLRFDAWDTMMLIAGGAWLIAARVMVIGHVGGARALAVVAAAVGAAHALLVGLHAGAGADGAWIAPLWVLIGLACAALARVERRAALDVIGLSVAAAAVAPWGVNAAVTRFGWQGGPMTNPSMWTAVAIAAALTVLSRLLVTPLDAGARRVLRGGAGLLGGVVVFIATSAEVSRSAAWLTEDASVRGAAVSVYWALVGAGAVVTGFRLRSAAGGRGRAWLRYVGLALVGMAALKALLFDLAGLGQVWRVVSFIAVGLLMIGVAVVYARVSRAERAGRGTVEGQDGQKEADP